MCGVLGLLPSNGRRTAGTARSASTLFFCSAGPISRDVRDAATLLQLLAQPSVDRFPVPDSTKRPTISQGSTLGVAGTAARAGGRIDEHQRVRCDAAVIAAARKRRSASATLGANLSMMP